MPTWGEILDQLNSTALRGGQPDYDGVRRRYLQSLHAVTERPVILYYSNWFDEDDGGSPDSSMTLADMQGFMETVRGLNGPNLDLILHLPGGDPHAAESILNYLRTKFKGEIRVFVPMAAMSAGTMLALGCDRIVMGAHSQLGPIDPQILQISGGLIRYAPTKAILEQFDMARQDIMQDPNALAVWAPILQQYGSSLLTECQSLETLAKTLVQRWLQQWMLNGNQPLAASVSQWFANYNTHLSHGRGIHRDDARLQGVVVDDLESSQALQDAVLSTHHATMHTFTGLPVAKIIENHLGISIVRFSR